MKPPIASPHLPPDVPLSGKLELDAPQDCLRLLFVSSFWARARCELLSARYNHYFKIGLPLFPATLVALYITQMAKSQATPDEFRICSWGCLEIYGGRTTQINWSEVTRVVEKNGDVIILRRPFYKCLYFITREDFADRTESLKFAAIVDDLRKSQGASWPAIKAQFET